MVGGEQVLRWEVQATMLEQRDLVCPGQLCRREVIAEDLKREEGRAWDPADSPGLGQALLLDDGD